MPSPRKGKKVGRDGLAGGGGGGGGEHTFPTVRETLLDPRGLLSQLKAWLTFSL